MPRPQDIHRFDDGCPRGRAAPLKAMAQTTDGRAYALIGTHGLGQARVSVTLGRAFWTVPASVRGCECRTVLDPGWRRLVSGCDSALGPGNTEQESHHGASQDRRLVGANERVLCGTAWAPYPLAGPWQTAQVRTEPNPASPEAKLIAEYLDFQRGTVLAKTEGLGRDQMAQRSTRLSPLTLCGVACNDLSLVEEDWMEARFCRRTR